MGITKEVVMEGGRFVIAVLLILIVGGGSAYYSYTQVMELQAQVASIQAKIGPINTNSVTAAQIANGAKAAADAAAASAAKANDAVNQLNATVAEIQTKSTPAKKK
jgi:uncharacterized protein HemX